MEIICLEEKAFFELVKTVVEKLQPSFQDKSPKRWLNATETMELLGIKSKTTLQKLRDEGHFRFSQPQKKLILYDSISIEEYLDRHSKNPFYR